MAGTLAVAVKIAVRDALTALATDEDGGLYGWQVQYVPDGRRLERKAVILGKVVFKDTTRVTTGAARRPRNELITLEMALRSYGPGSEQDELDVELVAASTLIEELLATRGTPSLPDGVTFAGLTGDSELDYWRDDDGVASVMELVAFFDHPYKR